MSEVVTLDEHRQHEAGPVICHRCHHIWTAVRPSGANQLECPRCQARMGFTLHGLLALPEAVLGDECCGQVDSSGVCLAPACIRGSALKLVDTIRLAYHLEHHKDEPK